jgi:alpha-1,3-mannosyltransferase
VIDAVLSAVELSVTTSINTRRIGRVDVAVLDRATALSLVTSAITGKRPWLVCFANAHTVNIARQNERFVKALDSALVLNDGIGVELASRWLYRQPFPDNLNGTDFTPDLLQGLPPGTSIFLLGGPTGAAERASDAILERHPHLIIAGTHHGFFAEAKDGEVSKQIRASGADLVLAAMGNPRQELWAAAQIEALGIPVLCVGALLDFYAGKARRAPMWVRRNKLEWVWRLMLEPRRLARRYLIGNPSFLANTFRARPHEGRFTPPDARS